MIYRYIDIIVVARDLCGNVQTIGKNLSYVERIKAKRKCKNYPRYIGVCNSLYNYKSWISEVWINYSSHVSVLLKLVGVI